MTEKGRSYYPVFLDIAGKRCVVVGGGEVALRKVKTLLENGARVDVISPELVPELSTIPNARIVPRQYRPGDLAGSFLAIAATDSRETNYKVSQDARSLQVLVNVVDDAENSDFILPALVRRGDITIAISTAGKSPALARKIRTRLEQEFGAEYAALAGVIDGVRRELKQHGTAVDNETWQDALDLDLLIGLVKKGETGKAREIILSNLSKQPNEIRQV